LEKLVADPDNGQVPVFQNTLPESVMAVLRNGPGPFWRSLCPFYKTTPPCFGGRSARSTKRPHPVMAVVMPVRVKAGAPECYCKGDRGLES
jgi:hypothetical protein